MYDEKETLMEFIKISKGKLVLPEFLNLYNCDKVCLFANKETGIVYIISEAIISSVISKIKGQSSKETSDVQRLFCANTEKIDIKEGRKIQIPKEFISFFPSKQIVACECGRGVQLFDLEEYKLIKSKKHVR